MTREEKEREPGYEVDGHAAFHVLPVIFNRAKRARVMFDPLCRVSVTRFIPHAAKT